MLPAATRVKLVFWKTARGKGQGDVVVSDYMGKMAKIQLVIIPCAIASSYISSQHEGYGAIIYVNHQAKQPISYSIAKLHRRNEQHVNEVASVVT